LGIINTVLQQRIDELKAGMHQKQAEYQQTYSLLVKQEMEDMQKKIEQLEKLKRIYTSQGFLDSSEIKAAGTLKTISMELKYNPQTDRPHLVHWLNIHKNGFALQLAQTYPQLTQERHLDVCYLSAVGFDIRHIAHLLNVKERTIERYMTDICKKVQYPEEGKKGFQTMIQKLCIHPQVKKESENIAKIIKIR
jgi:DNA-binding NarL/FixJ family response regulator